MNGVHLEFKTASHLFEAQGIEAELAEAMTPYATAYMEYLGARPYGHLTVHTHAGEDGITKFEKVQAFSVNQYLYVCRSIDDKTRVFKYFAPTGLLLSEADQIAQEHYKMTTLHLI
ncbi:hypothetical protein G0D98_19695 [Pseudomonas savastanoi pv. phaseolicola]|uniref:hypothetical protein n=1 Tax=Pseudomonas savastanoi TaxID=29438 RepID=UPI0005785F4F|nr:hypothetical protein [Pseudomonas savastanoi]MBN3470689.1 hypothetical protein [Pseudomonas savastanoi pv. phaseolicola]MBN3477715.1 hypothetical protein [Pseudomonas savastanoi pv. phaseolicola]